MKKITFLINLFLLMTLLAANSSAIGQLLVEDFNYTVGSVITSTSTADPTTGWLAHSGNNTANIDVTNGLTFEGYAGSGIGGAANLDATGQDINKPFTAQTSGVIYAAFIIKTETPNAAGYFFHFGPNPIGSTFFTRLYLNSTGDGVGIGLGNNPPATFVPITPGNPALLVVKLDIASKLTSLYVLNTFVLSEPATADHTVTETTPFSNVGSVALRQYNGSQRIIVDGIRVATTWVEAVAPASSTPTVSTPTFSPAAGTYYAAQNVTISIGTEGATIYYTTDGTDPDNTDTEYTTPIAVSATTTVKAIAYKTDMDPSAVASAVYTFPIINNVSDIATLRAGATDGTAYKLTGEAIMTFKTANRNAKYIQDSTGGILIDDVSGKITTSYNVNDGITGIIGTLNLYSGMLQFVPGVDPGAASSHNNTVTPDETTLTNIGNYPGQLVKVSGVTIAEAGNFAASTNYTLSDGTNSGVLRTQYSDLPYIGSAIPTVPQDIIGVVLMNNTTAQLVPRTADDFSNTVFESPTILVAEAEVATMSAQVGTVDAETITVNGQNLTGNIILSVTGTDASLFTLSTYSIVPTGGRVTDQMVTITYAPTTAGSHTATLTLSSAGVESVTRTLSGEVLSVPDVIITEVYGGGGNSDAPYTHDFFELYNTTDNSVSVAGWSIQYYSATTTGTSSSIIVI
ncbi:MAG: chitobiase/beta-hexosaminidase C-terminal domain-containing protein, partial [Paludibacter sp.]|nr:chitobiase/beta-hexosaminidase C-terminal domain-containing protein [Paludibacter sp.]